MLLISRSHNDFVPSSVIPSSTITFSIPGEWPLNKPYSFVLVTSNLCVVDSSNIINFFMCVVENASSVIPFSYDFRLVLLNTSTFIINSSSSPTAVSFQL